MRLAPIYLRDRVSVLTVSALWSRLSPLVTVLSCLLYILCSLFNVQSSMLDHDLNWAPKFQSARKHSDRSCDYFRARLTTQLASLGINAESSRQLEQLEQLCRSLCCSHLISSLRLAPLGNHAIEMHHSQIPLGRLLRLTCVLTGVARRLARLRPLGATCRQEKTLDSGPSTTVNPTLLRR